MNPPSRHLADPRPPAGDAPPRDQARPCPNCSGPPPRIFYRVDGIPAHSCLLMPTRRRALEFPRASLRLAHCGRCGFITNCAFAPELLDYGRDYEETQGYSPTFRAFARGLARDLIDRFDLRGKTALEIGCGKGEFLALLVELGMASGTGIDPAYVDGRLQSPALGRLRFIRDLYGPDYAGLHADAIVCRHTLEHIAPTLDFMSTLRRSIGPRHQTAAIFEVPDTLRVLREGAFWDLYHEHCSYFTPGSLARLFRRAGFEVSDLWLEYADQYILLGARPASGPAPVFQPLEDDLDEASRLVSDFESRIGAAHDRWRDTVRSAAGVGKRIIVWGSGSKGVAFLTTLGLQDEVAAVVDINPHKQGRFMPGSGQEIVPPARLREIAPDLVIVMNPVYTREIRENLAAMGLSPEILTV
jgi:SAM-dependent methyltransferase